MLTPYYKLYYFFYNSYECVLFCMSISWRRTNFLPTIALKMQIKHTNIYNGANMTSTTFWNQLIIYLVVSMTNFSYITATTTTTTLGDICTYCY